MSAMILVNNFIQLVSNKDLCLI